MENIEIWKQVKGYEDIYEISNLGNLKSLSRTRLHKGKCPILTKEKILESRKNRYGYEYIGLFKDGLRKYLTIHQLIAIAFIPNPENKPCVNHINGIKDDNRIENLEWCTHKENVIHSIKNRLTPTGSKHYKSKLTEEQVIEIRLLKKLKPYKEIAIMYNVSVCLIEKIINRRVRKHT